VTSNVKAVTADSKTGRQITCRPFFTFLG